MSGTKSSRALLAIVLALIPGVAGCGGSGHGASTLGRSSRIVAANAGTTSGGSAAAASTLKRDSDGDRDNPTNSRYDADDQYVIGFGHAASPTEREAITALVMRYYRAAATRDSTLGCSLFSSALERSVPEDYGRPPGPPALRGNTCPEVLGKLFKRRHLILHEEMTRMRVTGVRVGKSNGVVLFDVGSDLERGSERRIVIRHELGHWRIGALIDVEMP